jgi:hypothetical protein
MLPNCWKSQSGWYSHPGSSFRARNTDSSAEPTFPSRAISPLVTSTTRPAPDTKAPVRTGSRMAEPYAGPSSPAPGGHDHVGADAGDVELLAHHLESGPAVEADGAHAGVAPQLAATGAGDRVDTAAQQGGAVAGAPDVGVGGHAPEPPAAGPPTDPVFLVQRGDADQAVTVEGPEVHAGVVARVDGLLERLARSQYGVAQWPDLLGGDPADQRVRGIHAGRAAS